MNFDLTEERQMLQDSLRRYLREKTESEPEPATGFSAALWQGLGELGIAGALFSEEEGGFGGEGFDIAVVFEELGRAGAVTPLLDSAILCGSLLHERPDQIAKIMEGEIISLAHGEPSSRYDLAHVETRATKTAGGYHLTGRKSLVRFANSAQSLVVSARSSGADTDAEGISLFLIPADDVQIRNYPLNEGGRAAEVAIDIEVAGSALIGAQGDAFGALEQANARAITAICSEALGLMEAVRDLTVQYLQQRKQFGQPIGKFQALQHRMADLLIEIEQSRSAVINLSGHLSADRETRERHVSAAKNLIGRAAQLVAEEAIQMHGGIGMTAEYALGHLAKRLILTDHRFGDADYHLERFIRLTAT